jgi:16S rRNA processing protein RimM
LPEWVPDIAAQFRHDELAGSAQCQWIRALTTSSSPILMATIGAAQGLKGEVRVNCLTTEPMALIGYKVFTDTSGRKLEIERGRAQKNVLIAKFNGVDDRTQAEALNGTQLFVGRAALNKVAKDEDEFLYADLIGLRVEDETGQEWGHVAAVFEFGAGDILEIKCLDGKLRMIPFSKAAVPTVNVEEKLLLIDAAASGIRDEAPTKDDVP